MMGSSSIGRFGAVFLLVALLAAALPALATTPPSVTALAAQSRDLNQRLAVLLETISQQRFDQLEKERDAVKQKLDAWMADDASLNGQSVHRLLNEAYRIGAEFGIDVDAVKRIHMVARAAILRADFFTQGETGIGTLKEFTDQVKDAPVVGNVVHAYGLVDKEEERIAEAMRKRVVQYKNLLHVLIKSLTIRDPAEALEHMRSYAKLVSGYVTDQERLAIQADTEQMLANQNGVVEFGSVLPLLGPAMDAVMLYTGEDLAGNPVDRAQFIATQLEFMALPHVAGKLFKAAKRSVGGLMKRAPARSALLSRLVSVMARMSGPMQKALNKKLAAALGDAAPANGDVIGAMAKKVGTAVSAQAAAAKKVADAGKKAAKNYLDELGDQGQRAAAFAFGRAQGKKLVDRFEDLLKSGASEAELKAAMMAIQGSKHAMQSLKRGAGETIRAFNKKINGLYKKVDRSAKSALVDLYVPNLAKAKGLDPAKLTKGQLAALRKELNGAITIDLITNPSKKLKPSFDRDVTARIMIDGKPMDIPAEVLERTYGPAFYQAVKGGRPPSPGAARALMEEMDQVATDALSRDAYGGGRHGLATAIAGDKASMARVFPDPAQAGMVIADKANHPFSAAEKMIAKAKTMGSGHQAKKMLAKAEESFEEGFRNLKKQFDSQIDDRLVGFNAELARQGKKGLKVPAKLKKAQAILEKMERGLSPAEGMAELAEMGMTPRTLSQGIGDYVTKIHQTMGKHVKVPKETTNILHFPAGWTAKKLGR